MRTPTRRFVLGGLAAVSAPLASVAGSPAAASPDAEMIRLCEAHPAVLVVLADYGSGQDDCPIWQAYVCSRDAIHAAKPVTLAGIVAKARAAKAEAFNPETGTENPNG